MPEYARLVPNIEDGRQFEIRSCGYLTDFEERANRLANSNKREGSKSNTGGDAIYILEMRGHF